MKEFDRYLKYKAAEEKREVPEAVQKRIKQTFDSLLERANSVKRMRTAPRIAAAAACFLLVTLFLLPNISVAYAEAIEQIPVIGDIVRVITIRNYFYSDKYHEMNIHVPEVKGMEGEAADSINKDVRALTDKLLHQFYEEVEMVGDEGHGSIYVDYETVTNTDFWFTLKLIVHEAAGSGNTYFKYYHIDKRTGQLIQLGDLAESESFYNILEQEIKRQMRKQMEQDKDLVYWVDDSVMGEDLVSLNKNHNFYWNENGDFVIVFDKYEVAPGFMGTSEFVIDKGIIKDMLKPEYRWPENG